MTREGKGDFIMRNRITKILAASMMAVILTMLTVNVYAETVTETEPNDTMETAEVISANRQTPQEYLNADNGNTYVVKGSVASNNEDWFEVYLTATGENYFSINSDLLYFRIYDAQGNPVTGVTDVTDAAGKYHVYDLNYLSTGRYYIRLATTSAVSSYQFLIGNPVYRSDKVERRGAAVSLSSSNTSGEDRIDFISGDYPSQAQVYQILVGGVTMSSASSIEVEYIDSSNTMKSSGTISWGNFKVPLSYGYGLNDDYIFTYTYKSSTKRFTPSYTFYYVYPILP